MTCLNRAMLVAVLSGSIAALSACAGNDGGDGSGSSVLRSGSTYGTPYDRCRPGTCGDASNPISGTNAVVGPGPRGEDWHKGPRE